jgi:hypothetical protein
MPRGGICVYERSRDGYFDFRSGLGFTGERQLTPGKPGAFLHPGQSVVSAAPALGKNCGINAFSVIDDSQPKMAATIVDRHFDARRLSVAAGAAWKL